MALWRVRQYIQADGSAPVEAWLREHKRFKAKWLWIEENLLCWEPERLPTQYVKPLQGDGRGLFELVFRVQDVQYRPLGFYGPGERTYTLLVGATKKQGKRSKDTVWDPRNAIELAQKRKEIVEREPEARTREFKAP